MAKVLGESSLWGHGQGRGGVAKAVKGLPRPWGRSQDLGSVANTVGA